MKNDIGGAENRKTHRPCKMNVSVSLPGPIHHLDIIIQQCPAHDHLDLVGGKEASRTSVATVPKNEVILVNTDELIRRACSGLLNAVKSLLFAHLVESERVEDVRVGDDIRVVHGTVGGYFDDAACGNDLAVGEGYGLEDLTAEGIWQTGKKLSAGNWLYGESGLWEALGVKTYSIQGALFSCILSGSYRASSSFAGRGW